MTLNPSESLIWQDALVTIWNSKKVESTIKNLAGKNFPAGSRDQLSRDFKDYFYGEISLSNPQNIIKAHEAGQIEWLAIRIICNQIQSTSSPFWTLYRKSHSQEPEYKTQEEQDLFGTLSQKYPAPQYIEEQENEDQDPLIADIDEDPPLDKQAIYKEVIKIVRGFSLHQRTIWELRYIDKMSVANISSLTKINKNTLYSTLTKCNTIITTEIRSKFTI